MFKNKFGRAARAAQKQELAVVKQNYFTNYHRTYSCIHCRAHLANHDELVSKLFLGNNGRAYLFNKVVNVGCKQAVKRELITGLHAVADIYCDNCQTTLGWKYEQAFVASQKYKEGKYIIELAHMLKENQWDLTSYNARELLLEENRISRTNQFDVNNFRVGNSDIRLSEYNDCYGDIEIRNYPIASPRKELAVLQLVKTMTAGDEEQQQQQEVESIQQPLEQIPPLPLPVSMKEENNNNIDSNRKSIQTSQTTAFSPSSEEIELLEVSIDRMYVATQKGLEIPQTLIKTENTSLGSSLSHSQSDSNLCCSSSSSTGSG